MDRDTVKIVDGLCSVCCIRGIRHQKWSERIVVLSM